MNIEQQLYNLKMKILTLDDIPEHLKVVLANDIHLIESSIQAKNNEVLDLVSKAKRTACRCGRPYSEKDLQDGMCNKCYAPTTEY